MTSIVQKIGKFLMRPIRDFEEKHDIYFECLKGKDHAKRFLARCADCGITRVGNHYRARMHCWDVAPCTRCGSQLIGPHGTH